jgi:hypothetical protein
MTKRQLYDKIKAIGYLHQFEVPAEARDLTDEIWYEIQQARAAIGKRGGVAKVPKGFSKMDPKRLKSVAKDAAAKRWGAKGEESK